MAQISTYHLSSHPELYEPSRSNCFEFVINDDLNRLLFAGTDTGNELDDTDYLNQIQDTIRLSVSDASVPHFSIDPIEIRRGNSRMTFAGLPSFSAGSIKLHDYVGARTKDALMAWQALAYDVVNDVVHLAANYKYDCTLIEYNPDMTQVLRTWRLIGCWISDIGEDDFNAGTNDERSLNATIQFDRAIPEVNKDSVIIGR